MRNVLRAALALIILVAAYWSWALIGAAELASAAAKGDAPALMQRIDLPALRRSLADQITHAYLAQNPQFRKMAWFEQNVLGSASAGAANELLSGMLTPEAIAALLAEGRIGLPSAIASGTGPGWRMPSLGDAFRAHPLQVLMKSGFDGPMSFVVGLDGPEGRYGVHLRLSGTTWRLSGLDVPEKVSDELAHAIAQKVGKMNAAR
jgi:hypothetical protein